MEDISYIKEGNDYIKVTSSPVEIPSDDDILKIDESIRLVDSEPDEILIPNDSKIFRLESLKRQRAEMITLRNSVGLE